MSYKPQSKPQPHPDQYKIPNLPHYRFRIACIKKGLATYDQVDQIINSFFGLIGKSCEYEINFVERQDFSYIWFQDVEIRDLFYKGDELELTKEIDDPNWKAPTKPLIQAKEELLSEKNWDDEDDSGEMDFSAPLNLDESSSSSSSQGWAEAVEPLTLQERLEKLEKSYICPKVTIKIKASEYLRYKYTPEQLGRLRQNAINSDDRRPISEYGSIALDDVEAFSPYDKPCDPNVVINTAIPNGITEADVRRLMGKFATTATVPIRRNGKMEEVQSPIISIVPRKRKDDYDRIYVTYHPGTHDSHAALQMRAWTNGFLMDNGKRANFQWKRKFVRINDKK